MSRKNKSCALTMTDREGGVKKLCIALASQNVPREGLLLLTKPHFLRARWWSSFERRPAITLDGGKAQASLMLTHSLAYALTRGAKTIRRGPSLPSWVASAKPTEVAGDALRTDAPGVLKAEPTAALPTRVARDALRTDVPKVLEADSTAAFSTKVVRDASRTDVPMVL